MNEQLKPYKTVEEIAKKHRLEVSFIQKQLDMGAPIEHEHTKNQKLATEIALQHLDEIPDYYTRLKKMEADAKKHHKKFKDVNEATDGIKAKDYNGRLDKWFDDGGWVQTGGKYDGKPCAKQPGQTTKPFCRDPDDRANMSKEERNKRAAKKRREDPNPNRSGAAKIVTKEEYIQEKKGEKDACYNKVKSRYKIWPSAYASGALVRCRKVGAANWGTKSEDCWDGYKQEGMKKKGKKIVPNCVPIKEEQTMIRYCPKCKKDETQSECKYGPKFWAMYSTPSMLTTNQLKYDIAQVHPANESKEPDHEYSMARSELSTIISAAKRLRGKLKGEGNIEAWVQSKITKAADYIDAAADYLDSGEHNVQSSMDENISFEIGHTSADARNASRQDKILKRAASGQQGADIARKKLTGIQLPLANSTNLKTFGEFMQEALDKSKMKCNSPKSDPVGDSLTGKSHVVKACEGGKEKLIRFGQRGVKGSPKKEGESKEYASRRKRFQTRHAKNIAKGKMSAAYWANKVKW
jgi:hypothetical protein